MTARFTPPAVDAANLPFQYRWCGYRYRMPPTAVWITPERFPHGRGRLFLGNVDHALNDHWCDTNQVRQRYHSCHAFVVLRILCGRAAATGRIPFFVGGPGSTLNTFKLVAPPPTSKFSKLVCRHLPVLATLKTLKLMEPIPSSTCSKLVCLP